MASPQHQQLLRNTEASCDSSGDGAVSVRISGAKPQKQQHPHGAGSTGCGGGAAGGSKRCKYSISSSCSSGESGLRRTAVKGLRHHRKVPQLFERSAAQFWDPGFDSPILEEACRERCFPQTQRHFRYVLFYLSAASFLWGVYFAANPARCDPVAFLVPTASFLLFCLLLFLFTFTRLYARFYNQACLLLILATFALTLAPQVQTSGFGDLEVPPSEEDGVVLLLLYSMLHVRLYASVLLGLLYSASFEALGWTHLAPGGRAPATRTGRRWAGWRRPGPAAPVRPRHRRAAVPHVRGAVPQHLPEGGPGHHARQGPGGGEGAEGAHDPLRHAAPRGRRADEAGRRRGRGLRQALLHPRRRGRGPVCSAAAAAAAAASSSSPKGNKRKKTSIPRGQIIFRPFNMKRMEPVSILFADIVGFTKMSANKSAHALVGLLNDLFGRFDRLCELTRCEKISTLGDCYYCVAGCPEPRADHAYCCVEMGLGMIQAIEQFCQEKREMVDMRVGVHTGTVLCGILGMKRFKFDVWSNDVNLANLMEQLGVAGKVHLSEATAGFLDDRYHREDGRVTERVGQSVVTEQLKGLKTYLISGRRVDPSQCSCSHLCSAGPDHGGALSLPPRTRTPDVPAACNLHDPPDRAKAPCASCSVLLIPGEEQLSGRSTRPAAAELLRLHLPAQDQQQSQAPLGRSPKALNGLLSPLVEESVTRSQTSLCEMLQEKEKNWGGAGGGRGGVASMDHSALIPLRSKNFRERSDAHFVDVIKEDSLMKDYFFKPPINKLGLNFLEKTLESAYRRSYQEEVELQAPVQTVASPLFSSLLDVAVSCAVFLVLTLACFLRPLLTGLTPPRRPSPSPPARRPAGAPVPGAVCPVRGGGCFGGGE
ncbi:hypothetical protein ANANG_G00293010 [Anguilla anguilla]|uniref:adenylate cyclase n=1 Tax=Anguilla anguilla TaxID=7936 RepID=A0A9D3RJI0_ANGAN|nr:hypothetical protein ANANG_G00293010 [Anguilla anguilla]